MWSGCPCVWNKREIWRHINEKRECLWTLGFWTIYLWIAAKIPSQIFSSLPATGGDTGSHLWPVIALRDYGIPHFDWRVWNPGNYAGEPLLVHYFPLPFLFMAFMSYFMPVGLAFNIGSFAPIALLPPCLAWGVKNFLLHTGSSRTLARRAGALAGILSLGVLFNDGNSMWGGNAYSVLAGQFAHQYAFVFFFLFIGVLPQALQTRRAVIPAAFLFAAVVLSHAYIALTLPIVFAVALLAFPVATFKRRLKGVVTVGALGTSLSAWFWWPLIDNTKWTTPYAFSWHFKSIIDEVLPVTLAPTVVALGVGVLFWFFMPRLAQHTWRSCLFWGAQIIAAYVCYVTFAKFGLVDVRSIPHGHYAAAVMAAILLANLSFDGRVWFRGLVLAGCVVVAYAQIRVLGASLAKVTGWMTWNYSGWTAKSGYESLRRVSQKIAGTFDDRRVQYEHGDGNGVAGTTRVFEMLPFFAGRSVADGVYMQSSILAPMMFYHQAAVSAAPSCPFNGYPCTKPDIDKALRLGQLLGIGTYILNSPRIIKSAESEPKLRETLIAEPWHVYESENEVGLVEVPKVAIQKIAPSNWRKDFWSWFESYAAGVPFHVTDLAGAHEKADFPVLGADESCKASVGVSFGRIVLDTTCPGRLHVLKFSYHASWRASSGDKLWLTSPGFIGLVPSEGRVVLRFGQSPSWRLASAWSILALLLCAAPGLYSGILSSRRRSPSRLS